MSAFRHHSPIQLHSKLFGFGEVGSLGADFQIGGGKHPTHSHTLNKSHTTDQCCMVHLALRACTGTIWKDNFHFWILKGVKAGPLEFGFWSFLTFLHHGIEVERHLLWKFHKKIQRESWSNVPPNFLACIRFLCKVVHKIGRLRKFNRVREIELNFFTLLDCLHETWHTCSSRSWLQNLPQNFSFLPRDLVTVFQSWKHGVKSSLNCERS